MSVLTRRTYTRVPTPLAAVGYLLAFVAVCLLLAGRKVEGLRPELLLALAPTFYSHVYNFGLSYLCVAGIGYPWLMMGVPMRKVALLGAATIVLNLLYEGLLPILNTRDMVDAVYGVVGAVCGLLLLCAFDRWWMRPAPAATPAPDGSGDAPAG